MLFIEVTTNLYVRIEDGMVDSRDGDYNSKNWHDKIYLKNLIESLKAQIYTKISFKSE